MGKSAAARSDGMKSTRREFLGLGAVTFASRLFGGILGSKRKKWYKGNLHAHTLVSDGRAFPVEAALLYRDIGYDFLMFSEHNLVHDKEMWVTEKNHKCRRFSQKNAERFAAKYLAFRPQTRIEADGTKAWRYGTFEETAKAVNSPERFLLMSGCEYNDSVATKYCLHCNAINSFKAYAKKRCPDIMSSLKNIYSSFSRLTADEDALFMVNHPFYWFYDVDPLILSDYDHVRFCEIADHSLSWPFKKLPAGAYNADKLWDFALAKRALRGAPPLFATGTDDTHNYGNIYKEIAGERPTYGNHSFVAVAAKELSPSAIVAAMRRGDFYASTGVELADIRAEGEKLSVDVAKAEGKSCRILFYGTKRNAKLDYSPGEERLISDFASELGSKRPVPAYVGKKRRVAKLPADAGIVLQETKGLSASYTMKDDDLYVRAKVISGNAAAWTQPLWRKR